MGSDGFLACHTSVSLEDGDGTSGVGVAAAAAVSAASARAWASAASQQQQRRSSQSNTHLSGGGRERNQHGGGGDSVSENFEGGFQDTGASGGGSIDPSMKPPRSSKAGFKLTASINRGAGPTNRGAGPLIYQEGGSEGGSGPYSLASTLPLFQATLKCHEDLDLMALRPPYKSLLPTLSSPRPHSLEMLLMGAPPPLHPKPVVRSSAGEAERNTRQRREMTLSPIRMCALLITKVHHQVHIIMAACQ